MDIAFLFTEFDGRKSSSAVTSPLIPSTVPFTNSFLLSHECKLSCKPPQQKVVKVAWGTSHTHESSYPLFYLLCLQCIFFSSSLWSLWRLTSRGHLYWSTGCPAIWSNPVFWVSDVCCWMRLIFESADWGKQLVLPNVGGPHPISWRSACTRKAGPPMNKGKFLLPDCLNGVSLFLCL